MKNMNKWQRNAELKTTADTVVKNFATSDDTPGVSIGVRDDLTERLENATGCTKDTARRHIGLALVRKFGYKNK